MPSRVARCTAVLATLGLLVLAPQAAPADADPGKPAPAGTSSGTPAGTSVGTPAGTPSQAQVDAASSAAGAAADSVVAVRAALVVADQRAQAAAVEAAQAAEAFNGATYAADQAAAAATTAQTAADQAHVSVAAQRDVYADAITDAYTHSSGLATLQAMSSATGIGEVVQSAASMQNAEDALDSRYDDFRASATIADASQSAAQRSLDAANAAATQAQQAKDSAAAAAASAAAQTASMTAQRDALIGRLAQLQDISYDLAVQRQKGLERQARDDSIRAAQKEAAKKGQAPPFIDTSDGGGPDGTGPAYGDVDLSFPAYVPLPVIPSGPPPKPGKGASYAIAFARAQIGKPYVWAAAGPDAWDCSGLTMGAWANGGRLLPHYSVAQYAASTPINPADLAPGDLVFWGRSGDPASIYHVALYSGNGMIIQAPRAGVPVQEVSMYAWIPPNFYARP